MTSRTPGMLDPDYGEQGIAPIPPAAPYDPQVFTLEVFPSTWASDGSFACYGYNPGDAGKDHPHFTRLLADGRWDEETGHVAPPVVEAPNPPLNIEYYEAMLAVGEGGQHSYLAVSRPFHFFDNGDAVAHVAVARVDEHFRPWPGYGDNGIAIPSPESPAKAARIGTMPLAAWRRSAAPRALDYRSQAKIGLVEGIVRLIFTGIHFGADGSEVECTYLTLLDLETGSSVPGLGPAGDKSLWPLPTIDQLPLSPYRAEFFSDGSFLLLGTTGNHYYLMRCLANGELDHTFADEKGYLELDPRGGGFGLAAAEDGRLWVSSSGPLSLEGGVTKVWGLTASGQPDLGFNNGEPVTLGANEGSLKLDHLRCDAQQRLVLAGNRYFVVEGDPIVQSRLAVARLLPDGRLDRAFGDDGYFPEDPYLAGANDLYVANDGIQVLSLLPFGMGALYEVVAKLRS